MKEIRELFSVLVMVVGVVGAIVSTCVIANLKTLLVLVPMGFVLFASLGLLFLTEHKK